MAQPSKRSLSMIHIPNREAVNISAPLTSSPIPNLRFVDDEPTVDQQPNPLVSSMKKPYSSLVPPSPIRKTVTLISYDPEESEDNPLQPLVLHTSDLPEVTSVEAWNVNYGRRPSGIQIMSMDDSGRWRRIATPPKDSSSSPFWLCSSHNRMKCINGPRNDPDFALKGFVLFLFLLIAFTIVYITLMFQRNQHLDSLTSQIFFSDEKRQFDLLNSDGEVVLKGFFGQNLPIDLQPKHCTSNIDDDHQYGPSKSNRFCRDWKFRAHMDINYEKKAEGISCYHVHWSGVSDETSLKDCFDMTNAYWFGMGHMKGGQWPLNGVSINSVPLVTTHDPEKFVFGSLIKRFFISSAGVAIHIPLNVPLFVSFNSTEVNPLGDSQLCLEAKVGEHPYFTMKKINPHLDYTICTGEDILSIHRVVSKNWTKSTANHAVKEHHRHQFIHNIIWTTADQDVIPELNHTSLLHFASNVFHSGHESGFILIDNRWERRVGELTVTNSSFWDLKQMYADLKAMSFKVMLSVSPFIGIGNPIIEEASREERFIADPGLNVPLLTKCFKGQRQDLCALIDVINKTSNDWFRQRLRDRVSSVHDVDGYYFEGVQVSLMPRRQKSLDGDIMNPDYFQVNYNHIAKHITSSIGVNTAIGTQKKEHSFYRLLPRIRDWKSLNELVPTVLNIALLGYQMINPGSVGGDISPLNSPFDPELYVRWMQVSSFLPVVQFSNPPNLTAKDHPNVQIICTEMLSFRKTKVIPHLIQAFDEHKNTGQPVIRGMFFFAPDRQDPYRVKDQFSIGSDIIVAPVTVQGQKSRHIYLPPGHWRDGNTGMEALGGRWIVDHPTSLNKIPYFERIKEVKNEF